MSKFAIVYPLVSAAALATPVAAQEQFAGSWTIERADPAPWVEAGFTVDAAYVAEYVGKTVNFGAGIEGPGLLACAAPTYTEYDTPADGLFQGGLAEDGTIIGGGGGGGGGGVIRSTTPLTGTVPPTS